MKKGFSYSVTIKSEENTQGLFHHLGKWNSGIDIKLTNLSQVVKGPVKLIYPNTTPIKKPLVHPIPE